MTESAVGPAGATTETWDVDPVARIGRSALDADELAEVGYNFD
jgi:hypothetical protein